MGALFSSFFTSSKKKDIDDIKTIKVSKNNGQIILTFKNADIALQWTCYILDTLIYYTHYGVYCLSNTCDISINDNIVTISCTNSNEQNYMFQCIKSECNDLCNNLGVKHILNTIYITISNNIYNELLDMKQKYNYDYDYFTYRLGIYKQGIHKLEGQLGGYMQNKSNYLKLKNLQ